MKTPPKILTAVFSLIMLGGLLSPVVADELDDLKKTLDEECNSSKEDMKKELNEDCTKVKDDVIKNMENFMKKLNDNNQ